MLSTQPLYVHLHLGVVDQNGIVPHPYCKESHCCCCFADSFVQLNVQGEVAGDGTSEVDEVLYHLKGGVANRDAWDAADSLTLNRHLIFVT